MHVLCSDGKGKGAKKKKKHPKKETTLNLPSSSNTEVLVENGGKRDAKRSSFQPANGSGFQTVPEMEVPEEANTVLKKTASKSVTIKNGNASIMTK